MPVPQEVKAKESNFRELFQGSFFFLKVDRAPARLHWNENASLPEDGDVCWMKIEHEVLGSVVDENPVLPFSCLDSNIVAAAFCFLESHSNKQTSRKANHTSYYYFCRCHAVRLCPSSQGAVGRGRQREALQALQ
jgi:hypothetical protein